MEQDEEVIDRITAAQREELEREIGELKTEAEKVAEEARLRVRCRIGNY